MKKYKKQITTTANQTVYKKLLHQEFYCDRCRANRGCNANSKYDCNRSWKKYRKTQYREYKA